MTMRPDFSAPTPTFIADATLPPGRWDATVIGTEPVGSRSPVSGSCSPSTARGSGGSRDAAARPGALAAVLLLLLGVVGLGFAIAGGTLPRTLPDASARRSSGPAPRGSSSGCAALVLGGPR